MAFQDGSQESQEGDSQGFPGIEAAARHRTGLDGKVFSAGSGRAAEVIDSKSVAYFRKLFLELNEKEGVTRVGI